MTFPEITRVQIGQSNLPSLRVLNRDIRHDAGFDMIKPILRMARILSRHIGVAGAKGVRQTQAKPLPVPNGPELRRIQRSPLLFGRVAQDGARGHIRQRSASQGVNRCVHQSLKFGPSCHRDRLTLEWPTQEYASGRCYLRPSIWRNQDGSSCRTNHGM